MNLTPTKSKGYRVRIKSCGVEYYQYADSKIEANKTLAELRAAHPSQRGRCKGKPIPRHKPTQKPIDRQTVSKEPIQVPCGWIVPARVGMRCKPHETCPHYYPHCVELATEANFNGWKELC
jgi:hypothetical protein